MGRMIIIVHPSELVRRGILSVLENIRNVRLLCFQVISRLKPSELSSVQKLILFIPVTYGSSVELIEMLAHSDEHLLVGLKGYEPEEPDLQVFDKILSLEAPAEHYLKLAEDYFMSSESGEEDELSQREKEVLRLIALGYTNKTIGETLFISTHTVISHRKNITEKLGIKSIPGLTVYAIIQKIVGTDDISPEQLL